MNKTPETKNDGKEFKRFDDLLRQVISVPKEELDRREKAAKDAKDKKDNEGT